MEKGLHITRKLLQSAYYYSPTCYFGKNNLSTKLQYHKSNASWELYTCQSRYSSTSSSKRRLAREKLRDIVHDYASTRSDRTYVWGYAAVGALGVRNFLRPKDGKRPKRIQFTPHRLTFMDEYDIKPYAVSCGYGFTVFLCKTEDGHIAYGTGINLNSQLGYQEYPPNTGRILDYVIEPAIIDLPIANKGKTKLTHVACGRAHTVISTDDEGVFTVGNNALGQCGRPVVDKEEYWASHTVNKLDFDKVVKQVECGQDHTLILTEDGEVYSCGLGADGQTGHGTWDIGWEFKKVKGDIEGEKIVDLGSRADTILAVSEKGDLFGWGNCEYNQFSTFAKDSQQISSPVHLNFTNFGKAVKAASCGTMCGVINDKGQLFTWGYGILGQGPKVDRSDTPVLLPEPLFGCNQFSPDVKVVDVKSCMNSFIAKTDDGGLYGWGKNKHGNLGLGHTLDQYYPIRIIVPADVEDVVCGVDHAVVLSKSHA